MSWSDTRIIYDYEEEKPKQGDRSEILMIFDGYLDERTEDFKDYIAKIPRYPAPKQMKLSPKCIDFYNKLVKRFGTRDIISSQRILQLARQNGLNAGHWRNYLSVLWLRGYMEKYARGYYVLHRKNHPNRGNVGIYYHTFYRILETHDKWIKNLQVKK